MKRGRKSLAEVSIVRITQDRLPPPVSLTDEQKDEWHQIVKSLPADYFRPGDAPLLAAFCVASVFHKRAAVDLERRGISLVDEKGKEYVNPSHQLLTSQASVMSQLAVKLRLCPSARMAGKTASRKSGPGALVAQPWDD